MKPRNLEQLLGGYASGTLTPEEREWLFQEALGNQVLFDALADEEVLRDLLSDPSTRGQLLRDLAPDPTGWWERATRWMRRPAALSLAGSLAILLMTVGVWRFTRREPPAQVAAYKTVERPAATVPPPVEPVRPRVPAPARQREAVRRGAPAKERDVADLREEAAVAAAPAEMPATLGAAVLVRDEGGAWRESQPGAAYRAGDRVRIRIRAAQDGYVVAAAHDGSEVRPLTPTAGARVNTGEDLIVPAQGALELDGPSGEKTVRLSFSTEPPAAPAATLQFTRRAEAPAAVAKDKALADKGPPVVELKLRYRPQ